MGLKCEDLILEIPTLQVSHDTDDVVEEGRHDTHEPPQRVRRRRLHAAVVGPDLAGWPRRRGRRQRLSEGEGAGGCPGPLRCQLGADDPRRALLAGARPADTGESQGGLMLIRT